MWKTERFAWLVSPTLDVGQTENELISFAFMRMATQPRIVSCFFKTFIAHFRTMFWCSLWKQVGKGCTEVGKESAYKPLRQLFPFLPIFCLSLWLVQIVGMFPFISQNLPLSPFSFSPRDYAPYALMKCFRILLNTRHILLHNHLCPLLSFLLALKQKNKKKTN